MLFNSFAFLIFFPIVVLCYYIMPARLRYLWLLVCSYYFYMSWNARYAFLLAFCTLATYGTGILIQQAGHNIKRKKLYLAASFVCNLAILFFFKYFFFSLGLVSRVLALFHQEFPLPQWDLLLPVGISFYTFQALSYTADVYAGRISAERNLFRYALFVSFFPQLVAGPIERSGQLLKQIRAISTPDETGRYPKQPFHYEKVRSGMFFMLLGFFEKIIIAERACVITDTVYQQYQSYPGFALIFATLCFAVQIYCDFSGYSHIAIGAAKVLGFDLMENFHQPYLATSIQDFWRRWHISLSTWFRDYLYIPLGGNRKGRFRKYCNLMITFLVSGLWHGASLHFVVWGGLHGFYQVMGDILKPLRSRCKEKLNLKASSWIDLGLRRFCTFFLVLITWVFFRSPGVMDGIYILLHFFKDLRFSFFTDGSLFTLGLSQANLIILAVGTLLLLLLDLAHEKRIWFYERIVSLPLIPRWLIYFSCVLPLFLQMLHSFGEPASTFIYFQF